MAVVSRSKLSTLAAGVLLALLAIGALAPAAEAAKKAIFTLSDPRGDDHGDGSMRYPLRYFELGQGDLDLLSLAAFPEDGGTLFEATFAKPIDPTERRTIDVGGTSLDTVARFGFYTLNIDIYIDTDRKLGSGAVAMLPGRKAEVADEDAWEKAVVLTPRPFEAKSALERSLLKSLSEETKSGETDPKAAAEIRRELPKDLERRVFFPTRIRIVGPTIRFFVPASFLGGPAKPEWSYVVAVSGSDIEQRIDLSNVTGLLRGDQGLMILPYVPGGRTDRFGGARPDEPLQPPLVDVIVPLGSRQEEVLRDYDQQADRPVRLKGVVPAEVGAGGR